MNETMPTADKDATSRPPFPGTTNCHSAARPCITTRNTLIRLPANRPRQNRMVQGSNGKRRVKNGAVLQATAAAMTRAMPRPRSERGCPMLMRPARSASSAATPARSSCLHRRRALRPWPARRTRPQRARPAACRRAGFRRASPHRRHPCAAAPP